MRLGETASAVTAALRQRMWTPKSHQASLSRHDTASSFKMPQEGGGSAKLVDMH